MKPSEAYTHLMVAGFCGSLPSALVGLCWGTESCYLLASAGFGSGVLIQFEALTRNASLRRKESLAKTVVSIAVSLAVILNQLGAEDLAIELILPFTGIGTLTLFYGLVWILVLALNKIIKTIIQIGLIVAELLDEFITRLYSLAIGLSHFPIRRILRLHRDRELLARQKAWDTQIIQFFSFSLSEVYPEQWNDWQHWLRDIAEARDGMMARGVHHRFVSVITAYRLLGFGWRIGMRKIFVIVTSNQRR